MVGLPFLELFKVDLEMTLEFLRNVGRDDWWQKY